MDNELAAFLTRFVEDRIARAGGKTPYRAPLVGFAAADDPLWGEIRRKVEPTHLLPRELLPGARTVVAFFVPFGEEVVQANRRGEEVAEAWTTAYLETNALINRTVEELIDALRARGVRAAAQAATHNWDPETLVSRWSHKSAGYVAGLGTWGLHRMLITPAGCAGRFGSLTLDAAIPPTPRPEGEHCPWFRDGSCGACVRACPRGALREAGPGEPNLDRWACYARLREVEARTGADACGKCAVGPCARGVP